MALSFLEASLVTTALASRSQKDSKVVMFGRQANLLTLDELSTLETTYGIDFSLLDAQSEQWSEPFFKRLGATTIDSLDYSDYEGATLIQDMNQPWRGGTPPRQYDIVFDGGSLEHVFNVSQALVNAMQLVRPGGLFLSVTPADGWLGHGFHQLQPETFFRFFTPKRGFEMRGCWLGEFGKSPSNTRIFKLKDPEETGLRHIIPAERPLSMIICARKHNDVSLSTIPWPTQSNYATAWYGESSKLTASTPMPSFKRTLASCLPPSLRRSIEIKLAERKRRVHARAGWTEVAKLSLD